MSKKTHQLWHDRAWPGRDLITEMTGEVPRFPDDYVHVANVRADGPEEAVTLTVDQGGTPDDPRPWSPWERNDGVEALVRRPRDTGPGDVVVDPQGRAHRVTEDGFEHVAVPPDRLVEDEDQVERMPGRAGASGPSNIVERARSVGEEDVLARTEARTPLDSANPHLGDGRRAAEMPEDHKVRAHADGATMDGQRRTPSEAQMERVVNAIQSLREDYSFKRVDDEHVAIAPHGRGTEDGFFFWDELVPAHRRDALARGIDWDGFNASEQGDVIMRVLDGEPSDLWMRGVKEFNPWEDFAWPLTQKQHAAYLEDIAASYGMTVEEMDGYYDRMAAEDDAEFETEADQPLPAPVDDAADGADMAREALLRETHQLARDLGYVGFRDEYFNDPDLIAEWPDPGVRERELRAFWDSQAEGSYAGFRESHAQERTEMIMAYRDHLRDLSQADENARRGFYGAISALGRGETIDEDGRGIDGCVTGISEDGDEIPTGEEWRKLRAEMTHDYGLRRMEDRGVKYEDAVERTLDHAEASRPLNIVERARLAGEAAVERSVDRDRHPDRER